MKDLLNDPRLTAYALDELSTEETREFEMELKQDPKAQKEVEDIRTAAGILSKNFSEEEAPTLSNEQSENLKTETYEKKTIWDILKNKYVTAGIPALAASILIVLNVSRHNETKLVEPTKGTYDIANSKISSDLQEEKPKTLSRPKLKKNADRFGQSRRMEAQKSLAAPDSSRIHSFAGGMVAPGALYQKEEFNTEAYDKIEDNEWTRVNDQPLSTFSIDVDTASYANTRRFLNNGQLPPRDAVRIEEFINYFDYDYEGPEGKHPFAVNFEQSVSPWNPKYKLVRIALKAREIKRAERPHSNLVFLLDVSGSMNDPGKLPLLKNALKLLTRKLDSKDRISIVVYAGASGLVLPSTPASNKTKIFQALNQLNAGGSTNGGQGIELAYKVASENFIPGGINRVILATDGDFNVGNTSRGGLLRLIEEKTKSKVFLTVLGLGMGNYKDGMLEKLAGKGNGNYAYLDTLNEARKVLVNDINSTLMTVAKDVKIQVEFNPKKIAAYRLVGYENRKLAAKDFNDDKKDAGEIGAGHSVTAFYEVVPAGVEIEGAKVDSLKYQRPAKAVRGNADELMTVKLRYKEPSIDTSTKIEFTLEDKERKFDAASREFKFAASVASFAMILREDKRMGEMNIQKIIHTAKETKGDDPFGYRQEFIENVELARDIFNNK